MEDDRLKRIFKDSEIRAGVHFTNRVMHQIEKETAVKPVKKSAPAYFGSTTLCVFGVMYGLILLAGWFMYGSSKSSLLESLSFFKISGLIASVSGIFYLISIFDDSKIYRQTPRVQSK